VVAVGATGAIRQIREMPPRNGDRLGVRTYRELLSEGWGPTQIRRAAQQGQLRRVLPATYVVGPFAGEAVSSRTLLDALRALHGPELVTVLATAADVHGLPRPWPDDGLVHVCLPRGREQVQRPGARMHTWRLDSRDVVEVDGILTTTVERTLVDLMCLSDRLSATSTVDSALHRGLVNPDDVARLARTTRQRRGAARCRPWWRLADGRAESPLETRVRLRAIDGGYPPDDLQHRIAVDERTYYADLAWRQPSGRWLLGEADGREVHDAPRALHEDRWRANAITSTDADLARFTWADTVRPEPVPRTLMRFLGPPRGR
jgi:predicted transcriptional regulator of viral defense system